MNIGELFLKIGIKGEQKTTAILLKLEEHIKRIAALSAISLNLDADEFKKSAQVISDALNNINGNLKESKKAFEGVGEAQKNVFDPNLVKKIKDFSEKTEQLFKKKYSNNLSKAFSMIGRSLKNLITLSRTVKFAILAAVYAFGRLAMKTGKQAISATNTASYIGMDVETLQKYQHIASINESSAEEISEAFRTLSERLGEFQTTGEAPENWQNLMRIMGEFSAHQVDFFRRNPDALLQIVQKYAQLEPIDWIRNRTVDEFLGRGTGDLARRNVFTQEALSKAPFKSKKDIDAAADAKKRINEVLATIESKFQQWIIDNGLGLVQALEKLTPAVLLLADAISEALQNPKIIEKLENLVDAISMYVKNPEAIKKVSAFSGIDNDAIKEAIKNQINTNFYKNTGIDFKAMLGKILGEYVDIVEWFKSDIQDLKYFFGIRPTSDAVNNEDFIHRMKEKYPVPSEANQQSNVFNVNNNFNFEAGNSKNPDLVASAFTKAITNAFLNLPQRIGV